MTPPALVDTLVLNAYVVTMDAERTVFTQGYVAIDQGRITATGPMHALAHAGQTTIDACGAIVMPGMANGHNHLIQNIFRGYNDQRWPVLDIPAAVRSLITELFALGAVMDAERSYAIVRLHALDMLKSGYTATHDEHFTNVRADSVDGSWQAIADSGMRGFLCRCIVNSDKVPQAGHETVDRGLAELERLMAYESARIRVAASFVNYSFVEDPEDMRQICRGARAIGAGFGVDMTDNSRGAGLAARGFDGGQVAYYAQFGLLDEPIYAGKGVHLYPHELDLLAEADARLALVPMLRFFDGSGLPLHDHFARNSIPGLGTDAPLVTDCQDPFEVMRMAILAQNMAVKAHVAQGGQRPPREHWATAERVLEMATLGSAAALCIDDVSGSIEPGKAADIIVVDCGMPEFAHAADRRIGALVWAGRASQVRHVFVAGDHLIADGRSTRWNEMEVVREGEAAIAAMIRDAGLDGALPLRRAGQTFRGWTYR
ncbi:amidohydrolase family protein [Sphingomonas sp. 35-24ZXX]|uniref:amidohydrolase family protein n=1 Tax=Sphingomonas sp. 35-24ZXX TaxID=1545915 RepID=UPI00053BDAFC|nr:amidohydrolase family protein [Sphingomonas sp. 35-24ZXX]